MAPLQIGMGRKMRVIGSQINENLDDKFLADIKSVAVKEEFGGRSESDLGVPVLNLNQQ